MTDSGILFITEHVTEKIEDAVTAQLAEADGPALRTWKLTPGLNWHVNTEARYPANDTIPLVASCRPSAIPDEADIDASGITTDRHPEVRVQIGTVSITLDSIIKTAPYGDEYVGKELADYDITVSDTADWELYTHE